jgi:5-amino-6-(D-ribitylamino)uracil---L-tyrosine 4-hydroxyphenyl transferase
MKPKQIRSIIRSAGRIPAQRSTTYRLLKVYDVEEDYQNYSDIELDKADPREFGSYKELIKLDTFRYRDQNKNSNR